MPSYRGAIRVGSHTLFTRDPFTARCRGRAAATFLRQTASALHTAGHGPLDQANLYYALHRLPTSAAPPGPTAKEQALPVPPPTPSRRKTLT